MCLAGMSVYASYDAAKGATAVLVVNKDSVKRALTLSVDGLEPRTITFSPLSINIVTIPDDGTTEHRFEEYTLKMAEAGLPPKVAGQAAARESETSPRSIEHISSEKGEK